MSEAQSHERCEECGQTFTLVAVPWDRYTAESVLRLLRAVCCVCEDCLSRLSDADAADAGEERG